MKISYHSPRPYMVFEHVHTIGCSHEYANPSGHSMFSSSVPLFIFLDFMGTAKPLRTLKWKATLSAIIAFTGIMGFARIYQGMHTLDQIIYGWCLGVWFALFFHFCIREWMIDHVDNRMGEMARKYKTWVNLAVLFVLFMAGQLIPYIYVEHYFKAPNKWKEYLVRQCG